MQSNSDVIVVGGGIAGLVAATFAARSGAAVTLIEGASHAGGRARTKEEHGASLNLGPHAVYRAGVGLPILRELGIEPKGGVPDLGGKLARAGELLVAPGGVRSLLSTRALGVRGKLEVGMLLGRLPRLKAADLAEETSAAWVDRTVRTPEARSLLRALFRLSTYSGAAEIQSAGAAVDQLQRALKANVLYLDGGWQTLVDGLVSAAEEAGVQLVAGRPVRDVQPTAEGWDVLIEGEPPRTAAAVILCLAPADAASLMPGEDTPLPRWAAEAVPVRAAVLDLVLSHLPQPGTPFALGLDEAVYLSVHSAVARLVAPGHHLVSVAAYLPAEDDPGQTLTRMERLADLAQPGWRDHVVHRRHLPNLIVSNANVTATAGGFAGRPPVVVPGAEGLFVAGDWIGPEGMLYDAAASSGKSAGQLAAAHARQHAAASMALA